MMYNDSMKYMTLKIIGIVLLIVIVLILVLPVGIKVDQDDPTIGPTPAAYLFSDGSNPYQTEVICKYFVRTEIVSVPYWGYSKELKLDPPSCEFLTLYWHDGWLIDPGTALF